MLSAGAPSALDSSCSEVHWTGGGAHPADADDTTWEVTSFHLLDW